MSLWYLTATVGTVTVTDVEGIRVGHWTDAEALTGCSVVLFPEGTVASGEVRGAAPATREFALLAPERTVSRIDALVLAGGSAFGLAACDGVMGWLEQRGVGFPTAAGVSVPIVVGLACFDLGQGDPNVRPGPAEGSAACEAATGSAVELGPVGAGTGCTFGKWHDPGERRPGGLGGATVRYGELVVSTLVACNAVGWVGEQRQLGVPFWGSGESTTIGLVATNAALDKVGCLVVAQSGHDGMARAIDPVHTGLDGDALVAVATGEVGSDQDLVRALAARAVEQAVLSVGIR